ncbi:MAG: VWA domain-containing protein [Spirochaetales bacterium]|uniref:VWA domain-containing protein n=1 Tax=Candidatus Thalassospirochaeta sargassi TaxID=3119039 RepID=A0AAJ1MK05_9SPIO|nr:VWA domain-containing protein [Spirochaetales bacterium]
MMASRPEFFWLLGLLLPVVIIMISRYYSGRKSLSRIAGLWRTDSFFDLYMVKSFFISLGLLVFFIFAILSLAGFPGKEYPVSYEPAGTDIIFTVDVSESMKAQDIPPSRLAAASRIIKTVCENTPDGRFGVVVFKGSGIKMIPSTEDVESVYSFLEYLSTDLLTSPGSNIRSGVETAISAFPEAEERNKYIILITDGELHEGDMTEIASQAVDADVQVYCIGTGTPEGARIPLAEGGFLKDSAGDTVVTRLKEEGLRQLSESTGGKYYDAADSGLLPELLKVAAGTVDENESRYRIEVKDRYRFFLVIALLGLFVSRAVKVVKWKKEF